MVRVGLGVLNKVGKEVVAKWVQKELEAFFEK